MVRLNQFFISLYNAQVAGKPSMSIPFSKHTWECARALMHFGFLHDVRFIQPARLSGSPDLMVHKDRAIHKDSKDHESPQSFSGFAAHTGQNAPLGHATLRSAKTVQSTRISQSKRTSAHEKVMYARIECALKYHDASPLIRRVVLLSTPSRRLSWNYSTVVAQSAKPGNFLLLTQYGVLTETEALRAEVGGLPLCRIFSHPWRA